MPIAMCGFVDSPGQYGSGASHLIHHGPTIGVQVGFDDSFTPGQGRPRLPQALIPALVDTGATESSIDSDLAASLDLPFVGMEDFAGIDGSSAKPMHLAQIHIPSLGFSIYGMFAAIELSEGGQIHRVLLGRTFLRHFKLIFEGRSGDVTIEDESQPIPSLPSPRLG